MTKTEEKMNFAMKRLSNLLKTNNSVQLKSFLKL